MTTLRTVGAVAAGVTLLAVASPRPASAYDPASFTIQQLSQQGCVASLDAYSNDAQGIYTVQVHFAQYGQTPPDTRCVGWLMRSSDSGRTWSEISSTHYNNTPTSTSWTYQYWDGPGYRAKACMEAYQAGNYQGEYCTQSW
ncbi:hypothetical protein [Kitasatospora sp. GP82]|uniref:hypothetical protein n=1 Tax=Kitasatospora sp. GP82 TaxID=3035089 RepID=UPI002475295E|nr:hypothetical protein [Kitasatospora sp. GP82]MDH6129946.1 hypothetical protein [Kitasatospora sp. GP82]